MNGLENEVPLAAETMTSSNVPFAQPAVADGAVPPRTGTRLRPVTARWQLGRLVRVSVEAACGFIRVPSGELIYFAMQDVVSGGGGLRAGARVRFQPAGAGIPRALHVQRI